VEKLGGGAGQKVRGLRGPRPRPRTATGWWHHGITDIQ